jgi:exonuclease VII large subunit
MERGYGMLHADDGRLITSVTQLRAGDALMVHLGDGQATTTVDRVEGGEQDG